MMFEMVLKQYKNVCKVHKFTKVEKTLVAILMCAAVALAFSTIFNKTKGIYYSTAVLLVDIIFMDIRAKRNDLKNDVMYAGYKKRISKFKGILRSRELHSREGVEWLIVVGNRYLQKAPQRRILGPFATAIAAPITTSLYNNTATAMTTDLMINCAFAILCATMVIYVYFLIFESEIIDLLDSKYRLVQNMVDDLEYIKMKGFLV